MISCGKERAACRNIMIKNGVEIDGSASAIQVLTSFHAENILNSGIIIATKGRHHCQQQDAHQNIFSFIMVDFEAIACDRADQQRNYRDDNGISEGIKHRTSEILRRNQCLENFPEDGFPAVIFRAQCRYWYWLPRRSYSKAEMPTKNWQELKSHKKKLFLL